MKPYKIFIMLFFAVAIIGIAAGLQMYQIQLEANIPQITEPSDEFDDNFEDENPTDPSDPSTPTDPTDTPSTPTVKTYSRGQGYACVRDALKLFDTFDSYKITSTFNGYCQLLSQSVTETVAKSGDFYLKESDAVCSSDLGASYYRYLYSTDGGKNVEVKETSSSTNGVPDWSKTTKQGVYDMNYVTSNIDYLAFDVFYVRPDKNSNVIKFDYLSNDKYYIAKFVVSPSLVPQKYYDSVVVAGGLDSMTIKSLQLTYYIEKSTLCIRRVIKNETYSVTKSVISLDFVVQQESIVKSANTPFSAYPPTYR